MGQFEVWSREELTSGSGSPHTTCYVIDTAIHLAETLARGTIKRSVFRLKPGVNVAGIYGWGAMGAGEYVELVMPKMYAVIERDNQTVIRGWAALGHFMALVECKRCNNTGEGDDKVCSSCKGASFNPSF